MMHTMNSYFLLSTYYVSDTVLSALHVLFNFISAIKVVLLPFEIDEDTRNQRD